jgi:hypothetical protein
MVNRDIFNLSPQVSDSAVTILLYTGIMSICDIISKLALITLIIITAARFPPL